MAAANGKTAEGLAREERVADLVVRRFDLSPPIDVVSLAERFADLEEEHIPGECDGLVLGLLGPSTRRRPLILVNSTSAHARRRFTVAHELGHVLLGWHIGEGFLCDPTQHFLDEEAFLAAGAESEANRFAAELLLPSGWLRGKLNELGTTSMQPLFDALYNAEVSAWVACFRLEALLPPGHVFIIADAGDRVAAAGQTLPSGSKIRLPSAGDQIDSRLLDQFADSHEVLQFGSRVVYWWQFLGKAPAAQSSAGSRSSREILDQLLDDYASSPTEAHQVRLMLGGIIGASNSAAIREAATSEEELYGRFRSRFAHPRRLPVGLVDDPSFELWLQKRAEELAT